MGFVLQTVREGQSKSFTIKDILGLIGDKINDEIQIHGEAYRISSCIETAGSGGTGEVDWMQTRIVVQTNAQSSFPLSLGMSDFESLFFEVNSVSYQYGIDYHIEGTTLHWHGAFDLEPTDYVLIKYPQHLSSL